MKLTKEVLIGVGTVLVLALSLYLFQFGGWDQFKSKMSSDTELEVSKYYDQIMTNQKTRFALKNPNVADNVVWLFDGQSPFLDNKEIEYIFNYDSLKGNFIKTSHRVDVFFKVGDKFHTTHKIVEVLNIDPGKITPSNLSLNFDLRSGWQLISAEIKNYSEGEFVSLHPLTINENVGTYKTFNLERSDGWIEYTIQDTTKKEWTFLQNVKDLIR